MKNFYNLLINALIVATKNNFVWFALTYWVYLETKSVISTSLVGGTFMVISAMSSFWLGSIVDHHKKKTAMMFSGITTLILFSIGFLLYLTSPSEAFQTVGNPTLWLFSFILLMGVLAGNIFGIAIPTLIPSLVNEKDLDRANGMFGTVYGISFAVTSVASGIVLAFGGMFWVLLSAIILTAISLIHLITISIPKDNLSHGDDKKSINIDIKGTIATIKEVPGLFALIFFTTFNNLIGGVFMALMDAYGLSLVSVQTWGILWGFLSFGFIFGGIYISKYGLGKAPVRNLFRINIILWTMCIFFTIQPSIVLLSIGCLIWMSLVPFVEATEQTIIQKVVPTERMGRVFGFAQSVEQAASPITAFLIGPIAQFIFIPFMTTGRGVELIGSWFGIGAGRGIALVFILSGLIGLIVTLIAMRSHSYKLLAKNYEDR